MPSQVEPAAPPTSPGVRPQRQSVWPTVLGVIAIVWACFNLLGGILSAAMWFIMPESVAHASAWLYFSSLALTTLLEIMLVFGGVWLFQRRPRGPKTCVIWAVITIVWTPVSFGIGIMTGDWSAVDDAGTGQFAMMFAAVGVVLGSLLMLALPVFFLIWFMRSEIKEEVAGWREP